MNLPNTISMIRILLIPLFVSLLLNHQFGSALAILFIAAVSDSLDGFIARSSNKETMLGAYLDPMADKLLLSASFVTLSLLEAVPFWSAVVIIGRELVLILGTFVLHVVQGQVDLKPSLFGKISSASQFIYIILLLALIILGGPNDRLHPFLLAVLLLTILSGVHYTYRAIRNQLGHGLHGRHSNA